MVADSILLEDFYQDKLYAKSYAFDDLVFSDEVLSNVQLNNHAIDSIRFGAVEQCKLIARSDSNDYFSLYDTIKEDAALEIGGNTPGLFVRDAVNINFTDSGRLYQMG